MVLRECCRFGYHPQASSHFAAASSKVAIAAKLLQPAQLVGCLQECAVALGADRQGLTGTPQAKNIGGGAGRPHRPVAAARADAEIVRERIGQDRLELHAVTASGL